MKRLTTLVLGVILASTVGFAGPPALAAAGDDIPDVKVKVRSVTLNGYTGNIVVRARVKCTQVVSGVGTAAWGASALQDLRASAGEAIECDGEGRRTKLVLDPRKGRFHPGQVGMTIGWTAFGSKAAEAESQSFTTRV